MEEGKISRNKMMRDTRCLVQHVYLAIENVFGLLVCVLWYVARWSCLDSVKARGQVRWGICGLGPDAVMELDASKVNHWLRREAKRQNGEVARRVTYE